MKVKRVTHTYTYAGSSTPTTITPTPTLPQHPQRQARNTTQHPRRSRHPHRKHNRHPHQMPQRSTRPYSWHVGEVLGDSLWIATDLQWFRAGFFCTDMHFLIHVRKDFFKASALVEYGTLWVLTDPFRKMTPDRTGLRVAVLTNLTFAAGSTSAAVPNFARGATLATNISFQVWQAFKIFPNI